jgi:hypothetical protein
MRSSGVIAASGVASLCGFVVTMLVYMVRRVGDGD